MDMSDNDGDLIFIDDPTIQNFLDTEEYKRKLYVIQYVGFLNKWRNMTVNKERVYFEYKQAIAESEDPSQPLIDVTLAVFKRFYP